MTKAILVMDMPERCFDCRLWHGSDDYPEDFCVVDYRNISNLYERPDWCPLIKAPQRLEGIAGVTIGTRVWLDEMSYLKGWNACIDALEGKT